MIVSNQKKKVKAFADEMGLPSLPYDMRNILAREFMINVRSLLPVCFLCHILQMGYKRSQIYL